jgi:uncharacterized membrane protein
MEPLVCLSAAKFPFGYHLAQIGQVGFLVVTFFDIRAQF